MNMKTGNYKYILSKTGFSLIGIMVALGIFTIGLLTLLKGYEYFYENQQRVKIKAALLNAGRYAMDCMHKGFFDTNINKRAHGTRLSKSYKVPKALYPIIDKYSTYGVLKGKDENILAFDEQDPDDPSKRYTNGYIVITDSEGKDRLLFIQENTQANQQPIEIIPSSTNDISAHYDEIILEVKHSQVRRASDTKRIYSVPVSLTIRRNEREWGVKEVITVKLEDVFLFNVFNVKS